jgi:superfamily II DNA or RNA helicase
MTIDFSYQAKAAKQVLNNALSKKYIASILAACPGAGKTTISYIIINNYVKMFPNSTIVVLTEGQNVLKNQYIDELDNAHVSIDFTYGGLSSDAQVRVGLPQSIHQLKLDMIDLLIVDEAHNFYLAPMIQNTIAQFNPKHQILMTGSPTKYNLWNQTKNKKFGMYYISGDELKDGGVFGSVDLDVVRVSNKKDPKNAIKTVFRFAKHRRDNISKLMIACPTISYATAVASYLVDIGRNVCMSTSKNDPSNRMIEQFKNNKYDTLIVVDKGVLGFNDKNITTLIDMKSSDNIDVSYQLMARILRKNENIHRKTYYRLADTDYNEQVFILYKIRALMKKDVFEKYSGKNLKLKVS